jgi:hypothetical protein
VWGFTGWFFLGLGKQSQLPKRYLPARHSLSIESSDSVAESPWPVHHNGLGILLHQRQQFRNRQGLEKGATGMWGACRDTNVMGDTGCKPANEGKFSVMCNACSIIFYSVKNHCLWKMNQKG